MSLAKPSCGPRVVMQSCVDDEVGGCAAPLIIRRSKGDWVSPITRGAQCIPDPTCADNSGKDLDPLFGRLGSGRFIATCDAMPMSTKAMLAMPADAIRKRLGPTMPTTRNPLQPDIAGPSIGCDLTDYGVEDVPGVCNSCIPLNYVPLTNEAL